MFEWLVIRDYVNWFGKAEGVVGRVGGKQMSMMEEVLVVRQSGVGVKIFVLSLKKTHLCRSTVVLRNDYVKLLCCFENVKHE